MLFRSSRQTARQSHTFTPDPARRPTLTATDPTRRPDDAKAEHVKLMKKYAGADVQVKAAGGVRSFEAAKAMIEAGATRIGTSSGIQILKEMEEAGIE